MARQYYAVRVKFVATFLFVSLFWSFVFAENTAVRDLPEQYTPGSNINVSISVTMDPQYPTNGVVITENLPQGWAIVQSNPSWSKYIASTNTYKWLSFSSGSIGSFNITYTLSVPGNASGNYEFTGTIYDGYSIRDITGDTIISQLSQVVCSPVFSPQPGNFYNFFPDVEIACSTENAVIHYTIDGSEPDENSSVYSLPLHITQSTTIKARGYKQGMSPSSIAQGVYNIEIQKGDINRDRIIDISDVILCLRMAVELDITVDQQSYSKPYNDWLIAIADMNGDSGVDISDVIKVLRKAIGLD